MAQHSKAGMIRVIFCPMFVVLVVQLTVRRDVDVDEPTVINREPEPDPLISNKRECQTEVSHLQC